MKAAVDAAAFSEKDTAEYMFAAVTLHVIKTVFPVNHHLHEPALGKVFGSAAYEMIYVFVFLKHIPDFIAGYRASVT